VTTVRPQPAPPTPATPPGCWAPTPAGSPPGRSPPPPPKELAAPGWEWRDGLLLATKTLTRDSKRTDYAGLEYVLPKGSRVVTHLAVDEGSRSPTCATSTSSTPTWTTSTSPPPSAGRAGS
jgi:hypothetical protein